MYVKAGLLVLIIVIVVVITNASISQNLHEKKCID